MKKKVLVILLMALLVVVTPVAFTGCGGGEGPTGPSSNESCSGYGGGDERGKWRSRFSGSIEEYTGSIYRSYSAKGGLYWEYPYSKPQYNKILIDEGGGRTSYQCYEVIGNTMRIFNGYYDRI